MHAGEQRSWNIKILFQPQYADWNTLGCPWWYVVQVVIWSVFLALSQEEIVRLRRSAAVTAVDSSTPILSSGNVATTPIPMMYLVAALLMGLFGIILGKFLLWMSNGSSTPIQQICESVCVCHSPTPLPLNTVFLCHFVHSLYHMRPLPQICLK